MEVAHCGQWGTHWLVFAVMGLLKMVSSTTTLTVGLRDAPMFSRSTANLACLVLFLLEVSGSPQAEHEIPCLDVTIGLVRMSWWRSKIIYLCTLVDLPLPDGL